MQTETVWNRGFARILNELICEASADEDYLSICFINFCCYYLQRKIIVGDFYSLTALFHTMDISTIAHKLSIYLVSLCFRLLARIVLTFQVSVAGNSVHLRNE